MAQWSDKPKKIEVQGVFIELNRGDIWTTLRRLQDNWGWKSVKKVSRFVEKLEKNGSVVVKKSKLGTHLTLVKYREYQDKEHRNDTGRKHEGNTKETRWDHDGIIKNKGNKGNNGNKGIINTKTLPIPDSRRQWGDRFETFWLQAYLKTGKGLFPQEAKNKRGSGAKLSWDNLFFEEIENKQITADNLFDEIMKGNSDFANFIKKTKPDKIKMVQGWLTERRFRDEQNHYTEEEADAARARNSFTIRTNPKSAAEKALEDLERSIADHRGDNQG